MNRADKIIADIERMTAEHLAGDTSEGADRCRKAYRIGALEQRVRMLCGELENYLPDVDSEHSYDTFLDGKVPCTVGYEYDDGAKVREVWVAGHQLIDVLSEGMVEALAEEIGRYHVPDEDPCDRREEAMADGGAW